MENADVAPAFAAASRMRSSSGSLMNGMIGDTLTPVSAFCKIQEGEWAFLCESVVGGERLGRYSFLGAGPFLIFQAHGRQVRILVWGHYRIVYLRRPPDEVHILGVFHGAMDLKQYLP